MIHNDWKPIVRQSRSCLEFPGAILNTVSFIFICGLWSRVCKEETKTQGAGGLVLFLFVSFFSLKSTGDKELSDFLSSGHPEETFAIVLELFLVQTFNKSL